MPEEEPVFTSIKFRLAIEETVRLPLLLLVS